MIIEAPDGASGDARAITRYCASPLNSTRFLLFWSLRL